MRRSWLILEESAYIAVKSADETYVKSVIGGPETMCIRHLRSEP